MAGQEPTLSGEELLFGYLAEHLDGDLPSVVAGTFNSELTKHPDVARKFQAQRGKLQLALGQIYAPEDLRGRIRNLVQDETTRATMEASHIAVVERSEFWSNFRRRSVLTLAILAAVGCLVYVFMPRKKASFNTLEYIGYEALAIEEDSKGRIDYPTKDWNDLKQFVESIPGLVFQPEILRPLGDEWGLTGASVINYDVMKVVVINYVNAKLANEQLHHFLIPGTLADLPKAESSNLRGLTYQVYANDKINMVAWEQKSGQISILVGHRSAQDIAEIARRGTPE
jgi:hypothetical protein